jgi:hypothetical protein
MFSTIVVGPPFTPNALNTFLSEWLSKNIQSVFFSSSLSRLSLPSAVSSYFLFIHLTADILFVPFPSFGLAAFFFP